MLLTLAQLSGKVVTNYIKIHLKVPECGFSCADCFISTNTVYELAIAIVLTARKVYICTERSVI